MPLKNLEETIVDRIQRALARELKRLRGRDRSTGNGKASSHVLESVSSDASMLIRPLLDVLDSQDRLGVFAYDDSVHTVVDSTREMSVKLQAGTQ